MSVKEEIINTTPFVGTTPIWWDLQNIPTPLVRELRRRNNVNNVGMSIPQPLTNTTYNFETTYESYKGPMTPWVRVFSNGKGLTINQMVPHSGYLYKNYVPVDYNGFILKGGDGFYDAFGYNAKNGLQQTNAIIGYEAGGNPHFIDSKYRTQFNYSSPIDSRFPQNNQVPSIVPPPGVKSVTIKQGKEYLAYASVSFKCFGLAQLEYLMPFFLTPGINIFIEVGWNLFNQASLLDLTNLPECWEIIEKPQTIFDRSDRSNGNYGCVSGLITNYKFNTTDGFVYDCTMDITARQGFYAGMRTDTNAKISNPNDQFDTEFLDLRTFFRLYLPLINEVLEQPQTVDEKTNNTKANFLNYIVDKINNIPNTKADQDTKGNVQQLESSTRNVTKVVEKIKSNSNSTQFYDGKPEDRVFIGRLEKVYKKKNTIAPGNIIQYEEQSFKLNPPRGSLESTKKFNQYSFLDNKTDFDAGEGATEVWMQLDFVFELANIFMSNTKTKQFSVDISEVVINAHPNLISCDKHVLIPNPYAPKINKAAIKGGYVKGNDASDKNNAFISQQSDYSVPINYELENRLQTAKNQGTLSEFYKSLSVEESIYFACEAARKTFRTQGRIRDNIDIVINYLYYNSTNKNRKRSAAFPFDEDLYNYRDDKVQYKRGYYGYLKNIYISKTKLIEIVKSDETKSYKQFINAILNTINSATENFWKFDIVEGSNKDGKSILSIVDKNMSNFDVLNEIYMFELGNSNNVIKSIDFNVSLTNEQAINVLFGGQNSTIQNSSVSSGNLNPTTIGSIPSGGINSGGSNIERSSGSQLSDVNQSSTLDLGGATRTNTVNIPFIKFIDRMDEYQNSLLSKQNNESLPSTSTVPGTTVAVEDNNSAIESLQKYGPQMNINSVLCMCVKQVPEDLQASIDKISTTIDPTGNDRGKSGVIVQALAQLNEAPNNYKYLCLPPELKGKLLQMLDDGDYKNNIAKYSGVADNFNVTIKFDGIFSFRNLQVFAISNLPKPYVPGNVVFQVVEVDHEISGGKWETTVNALVRCIGSTSLKYVTV